MIELLYYFLPSLLTFKACSAQETLAIEAACPVRLLIPRGHGVSGLRAQGLGFVGF